MHITNNSAQSQTNRGRVVFTPSEVSETFVFSDRGFDEVANWWKMPA
jgi:hypothetical protein